MSYLTRSRGGAENAQGCNLRWIREAAKTSCNWSSGLRDIVWVGSTALTFAGIEYLAERAAER